MSAGCSVAPELLHAGQQFLDLGPRLQCPQPGCVRRGNVDDQVIRKSADNLDAGDVIRRAVGGVAILAHIGPDDAGAAAASRKIAGEPSGAVAIEAEAVDHCLVLGQTIEPLAGIAGLRPRRDGADLHEAEAERERGVADFCMLVEPRRKTDWVGKRQIPNLGGEDSIIGLVRYDAGEPELERPYGHPMGAFRIEKKERRSYQREEKIGHL